MKEDKGFRWGFQWGKVVTGGLMFLGGGGATLFLLVTTDRIFLWPAAIAVIGLFVIISGVIGEQGVW